MRTILVFVGLDLAGLVTTLLLFSGLVDSGLSIGCSSNGGTGVTGITGLSVLLSMTGTGGEASGVGETFDVVGAGASDASAGLRAGVSV